MNRRLFFRPQPLVQTAGAVLGPFTSLPSLEYETPEVPDYSLVRISRRAMATTFEIAIPQGHTDAIAAGHDALDLIDELEEQMTVFRDTSEISHLNAVAAASPVEVEERLFGLLADCVSWTRETNGAFDIATGALVKTWGFFSREGRVPTVRERAEAMARTGSQHLILNREARSVKYRVPGLEINLGAVGKGYALDRAGELLRDKWGVTSALLHGGGSSILAIGHPPGDPRGWAIRLRHPWDEHQSLGTIRLRDAGLGTSSATFQHFEYNGRKLGHLLDPRRGWPAERSASASVTAPTAAEADAMSTALFVLGQAGAESLILARPQSGAVLLPEGATAPLVWNLDPIEYSPPTDRDEPTITPAHAD